MIHSQTIRRLIAIVACTAAAYCMTLISALFQLPTAVSVAIAICLLATVGLSVIRLRRSSMNGLEVETATRLFRLAFVATFISFVAFVLIAYFGVMQSKKAPLAFVVLGLTLLLAGWRSWEFVFFAHVDREIAHLKEQDSIATDGS